MTCLRDALDAATRRLENVSDSPRTDAEILLAHSLGISRGQLLVRLEEHHDTVRFAELLQRRLEFEPVAYILGEWEFYSVELLVRAPLLVPRPETEHLVETVLDFIGADAARVLEIGVGTGCVSLAIACNAPKVCLTGTDINPRALETTRANFRRHDVQGRLELFEGDLFSALPNGSPPYDVICSNPPYVEASEWDELAPDIRRYEDPGALLAGDDGLDIIRRIIKDARTWLRPGGLLALEIGFGQYGSVKSLLVDHGYVSIQCRQDLAGIDRIVSAENPGP